MFDISGAIFCTLMLIQPLIRLSADDFFILYFSEKIRLDISCRSSADLHEMSILIFSEK